MIEKPIKSLPGIPVAAALMAVMLGAGFLWVALAQEQPLVSIPVFILVIAAGVGLKGLLMINPNEGRVLQLFGNYLGTVSDTGLRWVNPLATSISISQRVRSFDTVRLKVNDFDGNPIEIAAIVVWRVSDCAQACFNVDDYIKFVNIQAESALRSLATHYPYDAHKEGQMSLRGNIDHIAQRLKTEISERLGQAGIEVIEARISHLAYAPEIAHAMLQRQQASAVVAARQLIVEGAVGMVESAIRMLSEANVVHLDEDRKAAMVANLLVVLCGDRAAQPVVNAGAK